MTSDQAVTILYVAITAVFAGLIVGNMILNAQDAAPGALAAPHTAKIVMRAPQ